MAVIYTTNQGQTVDLVCQDYYGRTADVTESVLDANPGLAGLGPVLPMGTKIIMPEFKPKLNEAPLIKLWG
jgi:phage tail protein X